MTHRRALVSAALVLIAFAIAMVGQSRVRTRVYASGFSAPVAFVQDPHDPLVQFVVEQGGRIRVIRSGTVLPEDLLDLRSDVLTGGERGLLGLACSPNDTRIFVNFTDRAGNTVIARFRRGANRVTADPASRFDLRFGGPGSPAWIAQPFSNHNGGHLAFGPDGYLYVGLGDGGSGDDPDHRAQNPAELLGKMLRINVNVDDTHPTGYVVPPDNPFVDGDPVPARPEIWAFGLRNPWRYSFDDPAHGGTGALVIGDVGQGAWEEIDYEPRNTGGRNYGWRNREGAHDRVTSRPPAYQPLVDPIHEYGRALGQSVTGGYVYRGRALGTAFQGRYFFADFVQGRVWSTALTIDGSGEARASDVVEHTAELGGVDQLGNVSSFGVDAAAELYIVSHSRGVILSVSGPLAAPPTPTELRVIRP
jgi:glucose/arabinose dehydrogenase